MTQLARNPVEGGSVVVRLTFKDEGGRFIEPIGGSVFYTLYAMRKDGEAWEIVNNRHKSHINAKSIVDIILQGDDLALLSECTTKRRVLVDYRYLRGGEEAIGRDMIDFEVVPLPTLKTTAPEPIPPVLQPLRVKEVFEYIGPMGVMMGILFSESVDKESVSHGEISIYLGDMTDTVISGLTISWNHDFTIAYCSFDNRSFPAGEYLVYLSGSIKSVAGAFLGGSEPLTDKGFTTRKFYISRSPSGVDVEGQVSRLESKIKGILEFLGLPLDYVGGSEFEDDDFDEVFGEDDDDDILTQEKLDELAGKEDDDFEDDPEYLKGGD